MQIISSAGYHSLVVHGVDDGRAVVGCPLSQRVQDRITRLANECNVTLELRAVEVGAHELTIMEVPDVRGRIVTTLDGRLLRRVGGDSQPLRGDAMALFVRDRCRLFAEEEPLNRPFDPADFDLDSLNEALAKQGRPPVVPSGVGRALADLNVAEYIGGRGTEPELVVPTAAAVLFARDPRRFVPGAEVQLVRRDGVGPGPGPTRDREECAGPFAKAVDCCLAFIARHTKQYEVVSGTYREAVPEYPAAGVREAVLNALAHRDYGLAGATTDITVWDDRIEFHSPGPLPGHITKDNMRVEHFSRNRRLMRVLRAMGLVEEFGEGVDRMYREMEARLMLPPAFAPTPESLTVTLYNRFLVSIEEQAWLRLLGAGPDSTEERMALVEVYRAGQAPRRRIAELLPDSDVDRLLSALVTKGLLVRVGRAGGTQYRLSAEVLMRAGSSSIETQHRRRRTLLDESARRGSLSTAEAAKVLGEDTSSARRLLKALAEAGLLRPEGNTRARRYYPVSAGPAAPAGGPTERAVDRLS